MATSTEVAIATTTLGSAASSITFSSIPSTYTDLRVVLVGTTSANTYCKLQFNSDTAANYSATWIVGDGTSAASYNIQDNWINITYGVGLKSATPTTNMFNVFSYAGSTYKTTLGENVGDLNGSGAVGRFVGLWRSTSAINRIDLSLGTGNFATGTTATLYGIKAA